MLSLPPEEAQELGGGGPGHPRGPGAGACLELLLQGGHEGPMQMRRRGARGQGLRSPRAPLLRRGWTKQQQKRHPPGACGLHALPSLRSASASPRPPRPPMASARPLGSGGSLWLARAALPKAWAHTFPACDTPSEGEGRAWGLLPGAGGIAPALPAGCGTAQTPALPLGADPVPAGPASARRAAPGLSPSWPRASPGTACAWAPCPPASPRRSGPALCPRSGGGAGA